MHSNILKSETLALIGLTIKTLMVEPSATGGLGLKSDVIHGISYDSLFTAR